MAPEETERSEEVQAAVEAGVITEDGVTEVQLGEEDRDTSQDEATEGRGFPMPPIEVVIHNAVTDVATMPTPMGPITLARFITPSLTVTLKFDDKGKRAFIKELLDDEVSGEIVVPKPQIVLPGQ